MRQTIMKLNEDQIEYFSILVSCPHGDVEHDCPMSKHRNLTDKEKYDLAKTLGDEEILHHHRNCSMIKEGKRLLHVKRLLKLFEE